MPSAGTKVTPFRFSPEELEKITQIAEQRGGLSRIQVMRNALDIYWRQTVGRRVADLKPVRQRKERAK